MRPGRSANRLWFGRAVLLGLLALGAGCRGESPAERTPAKAVPSSPSAASAGAHHVTTLAAPAATGASKGQKAALASEASNVKAYLAAISAGRRATQAKQYAEALKAFAPALATHVNDAQALGEIGYAKYLARDYVAASRDLEGATRMTRDRVLRAQLFYNLGLVLEAQGLEATAMFALSNSLRKTKATAAKLVGKNACPVRVQQGPNCVTETVYADWLQLLSRYRDELPSDRGGPIATGSEARAAWCDSVDCQRPQPWLMTQGRREAIAIRETKAGILASVMAESTGGVGCPVGVEAEILKRTATHLVVRGKGNPGVSGVECGDEGRECTAQELEAIGLGATDFNWQRTCTTSPYTQYSVFDLARQQWVLSVTRPDDIDELLEPQERSQVTVTDGAIRITGPGCELSVEFASAGGKG